MVFGDAEAAVIDILNTASVATAKADLVGFQAGARLIRVQRSGGLPTPWRGMDNPQVTLDVYAEDKAHAHDIATQARAAIFAARGYVGYGLALYDVSDAEGMACETDEPGLAHYTLTLALVTRPADL